MSAKNVTRSIRFDAEFDGRIERLAAERGLSVSAYIRQALTEASEREERHRRLEKALRIAADLPEAALDRDEMWGLGARVPR